VAKCSFRSVVVPRDTVILKEGKKRILVPQEPLPISRCRVPRGSKFTDSLSVKTLDPPSMLTKVTGFEAEPFHVFENRSNQITKTNDKPLKLIVKWIRPKVIVQVSDQMDEAFLLPARKRIVSSIKIGDEGTRETGQQWLQKLSFTVRPQTENHTNVVGKNPDTLICTLDIYFCLVKVHCRSIQNPV
jgi:hypothetical protein